MRADPRVKLLYIILLTTLAVLAKDIAYLAIVVAAGIIIDLALKAEILDALQRIHHFLWLLVFIGIVQSLTVKGGTVLLNIGKINLLTTKGIESALEFILRMSVIVLSGLIAASTDGREMADALLKLKVPYELVFMSGIALRFLPVFREEFSARMNAIAMRGIVIKKLPIISKLKLYGYLVSPTVSGCVLRSEELSRSMISRGFRAEKRRTMYRELRFSARDWCLTALALLLASAYLYCMYRFGEIIAL